MLVDASSFPEGHSFEADVCIVGSGPAGMTLALELQKTGSRVLVVEAGGEEPQIRASDAKGVTDGWAYPALEDTRTRGFGGTSAQWTPVIRWSPHYGMGSRPLDDIDLEARPWVPDSGWPFDREHLRPYYERAHELAGLGPVEYEIEPEHSLSFGEPLAAQSQRMKTVLVRFAQPAAVRAHRDTLAGARNVTVLLNTRAVEVETAADPQHVSRLRLHGRGRELWASAKLFVLATGGIENARLLLLSDRTYPNGIGNGEDLVGRYFMEHVVLNRGALRPRTPDFFNRFRLYGRHEVDGVAMLGTLRLTDEVLRREGLLTVLLSPYVGRKAFASEGVRSLATLASYLKTRQQPRRLAKTMRDIAASPLDVAQALALVATKADLRKPDHFGLLPHLEQAPEADNRVTLSEQRDELGLRLPKLTWRLGEAEEQSLRRTVQIIDEEIGASGDASLEFRLSSDELRRLAHVSHHHIGTTRMRDDPKHGVVDATCRVHGIDNLYVAGSSVFPTSGGVTVTLSIMALALRLADHLKSRLAAETIEV